MTEKEIFKDVVAKARHCRMVTLSGGNPCMWDLSDLVYNLSSHGFDVALETQGTLLPSWVRDCKYITISPKGPGMGEEFEPDKFQAWMDYYDSRSGSNWQKFAIKIVIFDQRDIEFAKEIISRWPRVKNMLYLSVGNPWPPLPALRNEDVASSPMDPLLVRMESLWDDIMNEPMLNEARFLPQLHVLLWGNEQGR